MSKALLREQYQELWYAAKAGDKEALVKLYNHVRFAWYKNRQTDPTGTMQFGDWMQEAAVKFFEIWHKWNPNGAANFQTFTIRCVVNHLLDQQRKFKSSTRNQTTFHPENWASPLASTVNNASFDSKFHDAELEIEKDNTLYCSYFANHADDKIVDEFKKFMIEHFDSDVCGILNCKLQDTGVTNKEIATTIGRSKVYVSRGLAMIKEEAVEFGLSERTMYAY